MRIGTAGWTIPRIAAESFPGEGRHLQRYARVLDCAEINSSFHRSHARQVYERWAAQTPPGFRFSVKLPRTITHDARLRRVREPLQRFLAEADGLGDRLAVLLVQLPPSFAFEPRPLRNFFALLADLHGAAIVCEPRHASWFTPAADRLLGAAHVARAAADPARVPEAAHPGGWLDGPLRYYRWHGAPRMYWSGYETAWLEERAAELRSLSAGTDGWCIFDNTAGGAAVPNALELRSLLAAPSPAGRLPG